MAYAIEDELIRDSKLDNVSRSKSDGETPQPFTQKEILLISNHENTSHQARLIFVLAVTTGLKISELIALGWEDINFHTKTLFVRRTKTLARGHYEVPSNDVVQRKVELNDLAVAALRTVEKYSGERRQQRVNVKQRDNHTVKKVGVKFVFYNTRSDKPFTDPKQYAKMFFTPQLKALGIQHRGPKHTRHTFVVEAIKKGMTKDYIRVQLGCRRDDLFNLHSIKNEKVKSTESIDSSADSLPNSNESKGIVDENNEQLEKSKVPFIRWLLNLCVPNRNLALKM
jgi:integrase